MRRTVEGQAPLTSSPKDSLIAFAKFFLFFNNTLCTSALNYVQAAPAKTTLRMQYFNE